MKVTLFGFFLGIVSGLIVSCGRDPLPPEVPPAPIPTPKPIVTTFVSKKGTVTIRGTLKPGAKLLVSDAKKQMDIAVDILDKQ